MSTTSGPASTTGLRTRLGELMLPDERRLRRRLEGLRKIKDAAKRQAAAVSIATEVEVAERRVAQRAAAVPAITYPELLPITAKKDELLAAIRDHQLVIVAGETGSGKTTQLPKVCLELGRGIRGMIGHTQPRRLAARTVAERVAEELAVPIGSAVGWKVRFTDHVGDDTLVKLMTDGILLAEIHSDRMLRQYDTLIIDEAHERSLNIDFILGYLKQLLPRRPDLKVIITSATIDPDRFAEHFGGTRRADEDAAVNQPASQPVGQPGGSVPIIEVSGRTYPVEVRYRPVVDPDDPRSDPDRDQVRAISDAVDELCGEGPGDILVFLSGEREIRDTADALSKQNRPNTEILPLYARLSAADQHRVFQRHTGRRVVLATNIAETSLTVPGIKYVIDPGTARISRYSHRTKVQRLPIEPISQASANQRKGRCGRTSDGICVRLYSEEEFDSRPEFTDPEILRTNLASVILAMAAAELGEMASFPFLDPPDHRNVKAGVQLLEELGALELAKGRHKLTPAGRTLAQFPIDPRLARMVMAATELGCVREVAIIAAALSIQDPRERPADQQQAADQKHARFSDDASDFSAYLNLWNYLREQQRALSGSQFRKQCRRDFLNYLRVREWQDIESQLRQIARNLGAAVSSKPAAPELVHRALLAGLLSHIGLRDPEKRDYLGARGTRFAIFPGSGLFKRTPQWVMAAELVETSRLWARVVATIDPEWVEPLAEKLVKRTYSEPHWSKKQGAVIANERVTLYGVPLVAERKVNYGRIDPVLSRELFIRRALVDGDWETRHAFFHENRQLLEEVEDLEHRARRRGIVVDDEALFDFYDQRVGSEAVSARHFDTWWKKTSRNQPDLLTFSTSMLVNDGAHDISEADYPDAWVQDDLELALVYQFEPGSPGDGVTVEIPVQVLNRVDVDDLSWQVPGLREELVTALIRSLPKELRRNFVPAPEFAKALLQRVKPRTGPLLGALATELKGMTGVTVPDDAWQPDRVPPHLTMTFRVIDEKGRVADEDTDLAMLKLRLKPTVEQTFSRTAARIERSGLRSWDFGDLPESFEREHAGYVVKAYPALVDERDSVAIRLVETPDQQRAAMWAGTRRLLQLTVPSPLKAVVDRLPRLTKLALGAGPHGSVGALLDDCFDATLDKLLADHGGPVRTEAAFAKLRDDVRAELADLLYDTLTRVEPIVRSANAISERLRALTNPAVQPSVADIASQLAALVYPGFVTETGWARLVDLTRYLRAVERRLEKLPENPARDQASLAIVRELHDDYERRLRTRPAHSPPSESLREIPWLIEELRVSLFAQELRTPFPVSAKRIRRALEQAT